MKLLDILALELKGWPESVTHFTCDEDGEIRAYQARNELTRHDFYPSLQVDAGDRSKGFGCLDSSTCITRNEWQAAVDALKVGEQAWDGEGLPPVGCPIEYLSNQGWKKAECIAHKDGYAILWVTVGNFFPMSESDRENFRPIRTAEQIAAYDQSAQINRMINESLEGVAGVTIAQARTICSQLHKAGYRKQVQP